MICRVTTRTALASLVMLSLLACPPQLVEDIAEEEPSRLEWALAIHGGAGATPQDIADEEREGYLRSLAEALAAGAEILEGGGSSLDAVEEAVRILEDDPKFNAGRGAVFTHDGQHELDAAIMDGRTLAAGAVAGVRTVKNPIFLARQVKLRTRHILLAGEGAERFAEEIGLEPVPNEYFSTERRLEALRRVQERERQAREQADGRGTVGAVALDRDGNLAAATSTGGLTNKRFGRIGDVPLIGAGTYANNATCAVSATGTGEEFIRHVASYAVSGLMEHRGLALEEAVRTVVHDTLGPDVGGMIAVDRNGKIVLDFATESMLRGATDSTGRFEVAIW